MLSLEHAVGFRKHAVKGGANIATTDREHRWYYCEHFCTIPVVLPLDPLDVSLNAYWV